MEMIKLDDFAHKELPSEMKKFLCILLALLALCAAGALADGEENLVVNGDFSEVDASGLPTGWQREMWYTDAGVSRLYVMEDGYDGNAVAVVNADPNDARFVQTIAVEPDSCYRFSCMVYAENCGDGGYCATLSFKDTFVYSESVADTAGEWRRITVYGRTGSDQTEVTLMLRVGGYGYLNSGAAYFDDVEAVHLYSQPDNVEVYDLSTSQPSSGSADAAEDDAMPQRNTEAYLLMTALYAVLILALARRSHRLEANPAGVLDREGERPAQLALWIGLTLALLLRLVLAVAVRGYNTDINCFSAWSERIYSNGIANFYAPDYFCDYPPGYMLLLWPVAALRNLLNLPMQGGAHLILLKLIPILCDLLGALLIWRVARRNKLHPKLCAALALLYAFNPAVLIDAAAWGQIDSVFTLLIALCALQAADEKYFSSLLAFACAMLIKPQAMLFAPLGLFAIVINLVRKPDRARIRSFISGLIAALALLYGTAFAFCIGSAAGLADALVRPVTWLFELYGSTMGSYSYLTINALNLYALLGFNWTATSAQPVWTVLAWVLFGASYVYAGFLYLKSRKPRHLLLSGGLLIVLICTFGPMIHERYIFPALLLLTLAYAFDRDKRLLASLTVTTCTAAMNELLVLQGGMGTGNYGHLQASEQWLNALLSLINVINALYLCWVCLDICVLQRVRPLSTPDQDGQHRLVERVDGKATLAKPACHEPKKEKDHRMHLKRIDCILMIAVTLIYALAAFTNLGVTEAPQTSWVASQAGESVVFDLGQTQPFQMIYYGGICNTSFTVELSNDGEVWTEPCCALYRQGEIFRWIYYVPMDEELNVLYRETVPTDDGTAWITYATSDRPYPFQTARYVRITAQSAGLTLSEFGFWGKDDQLIEATIAERSGELAEFATDPKLLLDEQACVARTPSYLNSTYFDEIYHARTAYELQQGDMYIYEWTHPPLGKVLMMLGVELFGMTPFGWRFMGALMGVLMLPLMYLLAKQLTKSTKLSCIAMCLMALDSMHFTQTRIATIDSYAVFWIMLMYLFMFRYFQMDWKQVSLKRTLVPLGLCGVTMGVAIATKWIGAYAAVGLAVLFFWKLFAELRNLREDRGAWALRALYTVLFCLVFFIVLPALIYYLSYYPQLRYEGVTGIRDMFSKARLERVLQLQESMLNYHAGLGGDTHYFRSPWYQWPVIWWPMWYYSGTAYMPEGMISSISCMGNPAVWWTGLIALISILIGAAWKRRAPRTWLLVLIGFASQFLPWVLVPRSTFIYHYFASVPFIILCTVLMLDWLRRRSPRAFQWASIVLLAAALILFVAFYPLESGLPVARSYAQYLRWFKWYNF